jgi:tetratricopeptide (TPR) repeat protein
MTIDPYQNCPCGSGKKFKWCCQNLAKFVEKCEQLLNNDQVAGALQALDEGLAIQPKSFWLRTVKAGILLDLHDHEPGYRIIDELLAENPAYVPALEVRLEDELAHGMAPEAVATIQRMIDSVPAGETSAVGPWMLAVARPLRELEYYFAAIEHARFAASRQDLAEHAIRIEVGIETTPDVAPWLKEAWELRGAPGADEVGRRWAEALDEAKLGRWKRAGDIFESLATEQPNNADLLFNLGLCRGWTADEEAAAAALHRSALATADVDAAVHIEALAQTISPRESAQVVDVVRIRYAIRDHARLMQRLKDHPRLQVHVLDAKEGQAPEGVKDEFFLLDKDSLKDSGDLSLERVPMVAGYARTRGNDLEVEFVDPTEDDWRSQIAITAAGDAIDPNGERTVAGTVPVSVARSRRMWGLPQDTDARTAYLFRRTAHEQFVRDVWTNMPLGWLENKTPREAVAIPELKLSLRAALMIMAHLSEAMFFDDDFGSLRTSLGVEPVPTPEGDGAAIESLPLATLRYVKPDTLSTSKLRELYDQSLMHGQLAATEQAARCLVTRPDTDLATRERAFQMLIVAERARSNRDAAIEWIRKARESDVEKGAGADRAVWEIAEWELSMEHDHPTTWVPRLGELFTKCGKDQDALQALIRILLRTGLVRPVQNPSKPSEVAMDWRPVEYLMMQFGRRQPGALDLTPVTADQAGKIWTPDAGRPAAAPPVWSPGQSQPAAAAAAAAEKPKLWTPGS